MDLIFFGRISHVIFTAKQVKHSFSDISAPTGALFEEISSGFL